MGTMGMGIEGQIVHKLERLFLQVGIVPMLVEDTVVPMGMGDVLVFVDMDIMDMEVFKDTTMVGMDIMGMGGIMDTIMEDIMGVMDTMAIMDTSTMDVANYQRILTCP
ncbi:uncharacterized protein LOC103314085 isoform X1 [Tribolium castaneum]|uniref:uncharacterized protein LOC103314085 isoform X1 n=1 Tax=Tribolium castaneum TaxID=7070 RepID=UPI0030FE8270